jgi:hypothetical protein
LRGFTATRNAIEKYVANGSESMPPANPLLIQVVPRLSPERCGVSDHALMLAQELKSSFEIDSAFVVLNSDERNEVPYLDFHCAPVQLHECCLSLSKGTSAVLLVHVSGYGYSRDGAPTELANVLTRISADSRFGIAAYFHEIFASGAPWTSAFWHKRRQQNAVRRIADICSLVATNTCYHARWLNEETKRLPFSQVRHLPVFSTVGEAAQPVPLSHREPTVVVFGLAATRERAYRELTFLEGTLKALGVREILDIGPDGNPPSEVRGIPVRRMGVLGASEVARELLRCRYGYLSYSAISLAKSSIFAAYCAHGTVPVIACPFPDVVDGLRDGIHVLSPKTVETAMRSGLDSCSTDAWQWYAGHKICVHASTYARWVHEHVAEHEQAMA